MYLNLKEHITTTAIQLFSRNGIRRVSMDEVARKANVSKRTLYDFFKDKESLLIAILDRLRDPFSGQLNLIETQSETALEAILLFNEKLIEQPIWICQDFYEDIKRFPNALAIVIEWKHSFLGKLIELLKRGEKESVFMSDIDYDLISLMAQQQMTKTTPSDLYTRYTPEEVHNTLFFIFLRGICTNAGRDIIDKFFSKKEIRKRIDIVGADLRVCPNGKLKIE